MANRLDPTNYSFLTPWLHRNSPVRVCISSAEHRVAHADRRVQYCAVKSLSTELATVSLEGNVGLPDRPLTFLIESEILQHELRTVGHLHEPTLTQHEQQITMTQGTVPVCNNECRAAG